MITLSETQKKIIRQLNHKIYTIEFVQKNINRNPSTFVQFNSHEALLAANVKGFYDAVLQIEKAGELLKEILPVSDEKNNQVNAHIC